MISTARSGVRSTHAGPPIRIDPVPTPSGGLRHLVHLDPLDACRYAAAVRPALRSVERASGPWTMANRAAITPAGLVLEDWLIARSRFREAARSNLAGAAFVFLGDVEDCYGSIGPAVVVSALRRLGLDVAAAQRIGTVLTDMQRRGVRGLPVGPDASAILGNAVMLLVDQVFAREGLSFLRWVDDVAVFAPDRATATRAHDVFRRTLSGIGLRANDAKTMIVEPERAWVRLIGGSTSLASGSARGMIRPP
jgi:hypothetical protein